MNPKILGINTSSEVVHAAGRYYAVNNGVWFVADVPTGPWAVADNIPAEIYSIDIGTRAACILVPGGMGAADLLWAVRVLARELEVVGAEVVEVLPSAIGSADVTALVADRIVREVLTGIALRREAGEA